MASSIYNPLYSLECCIFPSKVDSWQPWYRQFDIKWMINNTIYIYKKIFLRIYLLFILNKLHQLKPMKRMHQNLRELSVFFFCYHSNKTLYELINGWVIATPFLYDFHWSHFIEYQSVSWMINLLVLHYFSIIKLLKME